MREEFRYVRNLFVSRRCMPQCHVIRESLKICSNGVTYILLMAQNRPKAEELLVRPHFRATIQKHSSIFCPGFSCIFINLCAHSSKSSEECIVRYIVRRSAVRFVSVLSRITPSFPSVCFVLLSLSELSFSPSSSPSESLMSEPRIYTIACTSLQRLVSVKLEHVSYILRFHLVVQSYQMSDLMFFLHEIQFFGYSLMILKSFLIWNITSIIYWTRLSNCPSCSMFFNISKITSIPLRETSVSFIPYFFKNAMATSTVGVSSNRIKISKTIIS